MNILFSLALLIHFTTHFHGHCTTNNLQLDTAITVAIPPLYMNGFVTPTFVLETSQPVPSFRAGLTVEAVEGNKYVCSFDVYLGNYRVWSSSRFFTSEKCVINLTRDGNLQLTGQNDEIGWQTATHGQGIKRLNLSDYGNLVLVDEFNVIKWQSFHFPTNVMLYGQRLSAGTKLTSPSKISNSSYSFEIHQQKLALYFNSEKFKYSYWEFNPKKPENISFIQLATNGLHLFNYNNHKFAQIPCKRLKLLRFLAIDNATGNLGFYYYSNTTRKFETSFQALRNKCDQPYFCKRNEICTFSNKCSCLPNEGSLGNFCRNSRSNMKEARNITIVLRNENWKIVNMTKESCKHSCRKNCTCVGALFERENSECYLYGEIRGMKEVDNVDEKTSFMVKVLEGEKNKNGLRKWELILIVVVDGIVLFVCLGGMGFYMLWKRKNEANNN
ncbi:putative non-specific serine/threonine protein kinase [Helianthus annuus]|nr:putative non-specific serine/threonine protein kinase [Helianthus annuus]